MSQYKQWDIQIFNKRTNTFVNDDTGVAVVMNSAQTLVTASDLVTLVSDQQGTALSQPVTLSSGRLTFYTAKTVTTVDISVMTANGFAIYAKGVTSSVHRLDIYPEQREQMVVFPLLFLAATAEVDTGFDLPIGCLVKDAAVRVLVVEAGDTVDIGILSSETAGDANGFVKVASVAALGYVNLYPVVTGGAVIDFHDETAGYGVFLSQAIAGADVVATVGGWEKRNYLTDGVAKSITYTPSNSTAFKGLGYLFYSLLD